MSVRRCFEDWLVVLRLFITDVCKSERIVFINEVSYFIIRTYGSGALSGLILDLIIENNLKGCCFLFLAPAGGSNPAWPYPNPFPNPEGQS